MTPAFRAAEKAGIKVTVHEYRLGAGGGSYGEEAARALGVDPRRVFKTLVAKLDASRLVAAVVPVSGSLDLKALARAAGAKRAAMAPPAEAERATGYVVGGISPLGQRQRLAVFVDRSVLRFPTVYVSAGRRGLQIELTPQDLVSLCNATTADLAR